MQDLGLVFVFLLKVHLYFIGTGPHVRAEWTLAPSHVTIGNVPLVFLKTPKGRRATLMETMKYWFAGRVTTRGNPGFLYAC